MDKSRYEVSHDLLALSLQLAFQVFLSGIVDLNLVVYFFDLSLVFFLSSLEFFYVLHKHLLSQGEHEILPFGKGFVCDKAVYALDGSDNELFGIQMAFNVGFPAINANFKHFFVSDVSKPVYFGPDVIQSFHFLHFLLISQKGVP